MRGANDTEDDSAHLQLQAGAQLFANNLCLFSTNLGALEASATGVSVSPSLINIGSAGVNVAPQAISISPVSPPPLSSAALCCSDVAALRALCLPLGNILVHLDSWVQEYNVGRTGCATGSATECAGPPSKGTWQRYM